MSRKDDKNSLKVCEDDVFLHFYHPVIPPSEAAVVPAASYRGRSLWIWTVWWWLQSLSAAGRWSDLPSRWWTPPHSWESKPSGSTRLPLQQETGNRKSERELLWIVLLLLQITLKEKKKNIRTSHRENYQSVWTFALMPALFLYLLLVFVNVVRVSRIQNIISHPTQGSSCWNECKLWSGSKVFVSNHSLTEQMRAGAASPRQSGIICLRPSPPLPPLDRPAIRRFPKLHESTQSHQTMTDIHDN